MAKPIELYISSGRYRAAYDCLNDQEYVGPAKILAPRNIRESDDGTTARFTQRVVVGRWFDPKNPKHVQRAYRAIDRLFTRSCRCEHDCCGCWNGSAFVRHIKGRQFIAHAGYGMNI